MSILSMFRRSEVAAPVAAATPISQTTLEDLLAELDRYGEPRLSKHDNMSDEQKRWLCVVSARVTATGVSFEAKAWAGTPRDAARQCLENLQRALTQTDGAQ